MSNLEEPNPDLVAPARTANGPVGQEIEHEKELAAIERAQSADLHKSGLQRYDKVDKELAKYVADEAIDISDAENTRLRRLIDKRVLIVMITTYFIQAIDKGTLSFASIMGIRKDTGLQNQDVSLAPASDNTRLCGF